MKSKFAYLLSAGGSLLSREQLARRMRLPERKALLITALTSAHRETKAREKTGPRSESKIALLSQLIENMARGSRGAEKARQS